MVKWRVSGLERNSYLRVLTSKEATHTADIDRPFRNSYLELGIDIPRGGVNVFISSVTKHPYIQRRTS